MQDFINENEIDIAELITFNMTILASLFKHVIDDREEVKRYLVIYSKQVLETYDGLNKSA